MKNSGLALGTMFVLLFAWSAASCTSAHTNPEAFAAWKNGPSADPAFFPIAVWLQEPKDAPLYKAAGINTYVGLWEGPTEDQLAALTKARMPVFCEMNAVALKHLNDPIIIGWMHGDEPDNAENSPGKDAAGNPLPKQPIAPADVIAEYQRYRRMDPTRPIMLNLGQGVANDTWKGRGKDNGNLAPYKSYVKAGDIISFDIYPVSGNGNPDRGNLSQEGKGIDRLKDWTHGKKIIWNCIECTQINGDRPDKITPEQMRSAVWISLIHGSTGLIYFCHQFGAGHSSRHLLEDPPMLAAVTAVNKEIRDLAPVLNSATVADLVSVNSPAAGFAIDTMVKKHDGAIYIFAARSGYSNASDSAGIPPYSPDRIFQVKGLPPAATAEVLGESRTIPIQNGQFQDTFSRPFAIHIYVIHAK